MIKKLLAAALVRFLLSFSIFGYSNTRYFHNTSVVAQTQARKKFLSFLFGEKINCEFNVFVMEKDGKVLDYPRGISQ